MNNCSPSGSLDTDSFHKAMLSYRNTVDPVTKFSPALAIYGRQMRDGLPVLPGQYNPLILHSPQCDQFKYGQA